MELQERRQYTLRNAKEDDLERIMQINRATLPENYPYYVFSELLRDYGQAFFVAEIENDVIGYVMPRIEWGFSEVRQLPSLVKKGHVVSIAVLEPFRKNGIGTNLLKASMKGMRVAYGADEVYLEVRITNYPAISVYERLGFRRVKTLRHYYMDGEDAYLMARELNQNSLLELS
ncbi:ribosomal-protein-alanine N-acetyltransferase RimI [Sulfodiicoccus acidiphilus]|uniref:N-alpha-acetyltransferase n=1 Tax=Sulfodiicoccus acidiphilus TaxID=1670455 RepID=A0A348B2M5_9CREN|nr:N-acetyltransferase [Sulfodiicoccus acidiphilus]BBD72427.1 ribosomal-protein-alanine N-acetyltransferase RimI [Sulfodiicoccus acidiphilus]GGT97202.1 ribosomal-protein-alanine N-acetyltransferase RimI [Sulfodiicoccus acidiphilus]